MVGRGRAAGKLERSQEAIHDTVRLPASQNFPAGASIETVDRRYIRDAVTLEAVSNVGFVQVATDTREIALQRFHRFAFGKAWAVELVGHAETREQNVDRFGIA